MQQGEVTERPLVFVDIETTGGSPASSRVLELAAIRVEGGKIVSTINTLIDAGEPVPPFITSLTGIREGDQWGAPNFPSIADKLADLLAGGYFVAHNVAFDYGFIAAEYRRLDRSLATPRLCTVKLSRRLYPQYRSHRLAAVIDRHNIAVHKRHRAYDDALALVEFVKMAEGEHGASAVRSAWSAQLPKSLAF